MAIVGPSSVTVGTSLSVISSFSMGYTVPSGLTDPVLVVCVSLDNSKNPPNTLIGGTNYGGAAFGIAKRISSPAGEDSRSIMLYLVNPTPGLANVNLVWADTINKGLVVTAFMLEGVDQASPFTGTASSTSTADPTTMDVVTVADQLIVDVLTNQRARNTELGIPGAGQTKLPTTNLGDKKLSSFISSEVAVGTPTVMSWSDWISDFVARGAHIGVAFNPSAASALTLTPAPVSAAVSHPASALDTPLVLSPAPLSLAASSPVVTLPRALAVAPVLAALSLPAAALHVALELTPAPVSLSVTAPAATIDAPLVLSPAPVVATIGVPAPVLALPLALAPAPVLAAVSSPVSTVTIATILTPAPVTMSALAPVVALDTPLLLQPGSLSGSVSSPAVALDLPLAVLPAPVLVVPSVPASTLVVAPPGIALSPAPVAMSVSLPLPQLDTPLALLPAALSSSILGPAVALDLPLALIPASVQLSVVGPPSTVVVAAAAIVLSPSPVVSSVSGPLVSLDLPLALLPAPTLVALSLPASTLDVAIQQQPLFVIPSPVALSVSGPQSTLDAPQVLLPTALSASVSTPAASLDAPQVLLPQAVSASVSHPAGSLDLPLSLAPAALSATVTAPPAVLNVAGTAVQLTPAPVTVSLSAPAPSLLTPLVLVPAQLLATVTSPYSTIGTAGPPPFHGARNLLLRGGNFDQDSSLRVESPAETAPTGGSLSRGRIRGGGSSTGTGQRREEMNVIHLLLDDAGRLQFGAYDDLNSWPAGYPYPDTPWLDSKIADGVRGTKTRRSPRCSPHRAEEMSGRHAHVSPGHPYGTLVGEVPNAEYITPELPFLGLRPEHRPFPEVARTAGTKHKMGLFGKYHIYEYNGPVSESARVDILAPCSVAGWDIFERTNLSGAGAPSFGYFGYGWETIERDPATGDCRVTGTGTDPGQTSASKVFNETHLFNRMTAWLSEILTADPSQLFFLQWWMHAPHGLLPALEPGIGPLTNLIANNTAGGTPIDLYTGDFDLAAQVGDLANPGAAGQNASSTSGLTYAGGHDTLGNVFAPGGFGPAGECNVLWRRQYTMIKIFDKLGALLEQWLENNYPDVAAKTLWVIDSDNGIVSTDFTPTPDASSNPAAPLLGGMIDGVANPFPVLPPTVDGTRFGEQYHVAADGKGTCHDEGILSPLVLWSKMIPSHLRGVDSPALITSVDNYATFLDVLAPPGVPGVTYWKEAIGAVDLAKVDSVSFLDGIFDITSGTKDYGFAQVFGPAAAPVGSETWIERMLVNRAGWKLHRSLDLFPLDGSPAVDEWNLYNLNVDPREKDTTLYAAAVADPTSEAGRQLADLQAEYDRRLA